MQEYWLDPPEEQDCRPIAGNCFICGNELRGEDEVWEQDDFVETDDGLICADCWHRYYKYLKRRM